jgi:isoquinoline 1-oxidoreductase beta subunit
MTNTTSSFEMKRRSFLIGSGSLAAGGLAIGVVGGLPALMAGEAVAATPAGMGFGASEAGGNEVGVWVVIKPDDTCVIRIARSEMGQGTRTGLAQSHNRNANARSKRGA